MIEIQIRSRDANDNMKIFARKQLEVGSLGKTRGTVNEELGEWFAGLGMGAPENAYAAYTVNGENFYIIDPDADSYPRRLVLSLLGEWI